MAEVTAALVAELRRRTGAGIVACKSALTECSGDMEQAIDFLRKKGLASAAKKSGRAALEGLIAISSDSKSAAIVEVNSETDFVAKNEKFITLAKRIAKTSHALKEGNSETLLKSKFSDDTATIGEELLNTVAIIGENIKLGASYYISADYIAKYIHAAASQDAGRIGVLVAFESDNTINEELIGELGKNIAMHIAAAKPQFSYISMVDQVNITKEREIAKEKALASGKPESALEKIIEGRERKFYEEVVLMEQKYALDEKVKISSLIEDTEQKLGFKIKLKGFIRFCIGDPEGNVVSILGN